MKFSDLATVVGKGGLFKVLKPTKTGALIESLDKKKTKLLVHSHNKVSVLSDISIYTEDGESEPLESVLKNIHSKFNGAIDVYKNSSNEELKFFLHEILPNYDKERVFVSNIKKLVTWYSQILEFAPELLLEKESTTEEDKKDE